MTGYVRGGIARHCWYLPAPVGLRLACSSSGNNPKGRKRGRSCPAREAVSCGCPKRVELIFGQLLAATSVHVGLVFVKHPVPAGQTQSDPFLFSF